MINLDQDMVAFAVKQTELFHSEKKARKRYGGGVPCVYIYMHVDLSIAA